MRPVSTAAAGPVHDSPLGAGLGLRGPALEGCGSSGLRGRRRPLRIGGLCLQGFVLSWTLRYGSGLSQVSQWFHLLPWILCVSTRRHKTRCFWWNVCNGRILVFDEESVFHIGSDRRPREGEQRVTVGGRRGGRRLAGRGGGRRGAELLLLLLLLGQLEVRGCVQKLGLAVRELLLVVDGDLLLDHHLLLLEVDLLLLLNQGVGLDLRVGG